MIEGDEDFEWEALPLRIEARIFVMQYLHTRELRRLWLGLPAVCLAGVLLAACVLAGSRETKLKEIYRAAVQTSLKEDKDETTELYLRRLLVDTPDHVVTMYQLAVLSARRGQQARAQQLMRRIAPVDASGYAPAHLWLAERALAQGSLPMHEVQLVESDLLRASGDANVKSAAQALLAALYLRHDRVQEAEPLLKSLAVKGGQHRVTAASAYQILGRGADMRREASRAVDELRVEIENQPQNDTLRLWLADASVLAGRWTDGEQSLRAGILLDPDGRCVPSLARLYVNWAATLARESGTASQARQDALRDKALAVLEESKVSSADSQLLLAEIALSAGDEARAEAVLRRIAPENVSARLRLARLLRNQHHDEAADAEAQLGLHDCLEALQNAPDNLMLRLQAADAAELLRDYDQAIDLLRELAASGRHPRLAESVAMLHLAQWEAKYGASSQHQQADDIQLLLRAFEWAPWNASVVRRLWSIAREQTSAGEAADDFLNAQLAARDVPAIGHLVLGSAAAQTGDFTTAREHLELAYRHAPQLLSVANNLAWTLAHCDPPDLPRALGLVDDLLAREKNVDVLHTRGHIYLKQERWRDAIGDLERVLPFRPRDASLHRALALAFGKLNLPKLAVRHAQQAEELAPDTGVAGTKSPQLSPQLSPQ